ncbi:MAG TPA: metalloregulator ArsR/SmtB family transcription factor [Streptosporangiaceae bacterium]|nr:metalloregulator ArsR/SmtB family transcription factor [Streptosporangiaceae bacterium]
MSVSPASRGQLSPIDQHTAGLIADAMFALSAPSRVQILGCLLGGPLAVGEITELLGMEQSAVSHQLRVLREAELVKAERHGKRRLYKLSGDAVRELLTAARHLAGQSRPGGSRGQEAAAAMDG